MRLPGEVDVDFVLREEGVSWCIWQLEAFASAGGHLGQIDVPPSVDEHRGLVGLRVGRCHQPRGRRTKAEARHNDVLSVHEVLDRGVFQCQFPGLCERCGWLVRACAHVNPLFVAPSSRPVLRARARARARARTSPTSLARYSTCFCRNSLS